MSEKKIVRGSQDTVEKIIENMTSERQTNDGQYFPLGFSTQTTEPLNWSPQSPSNIYRNFGVHYGDSSLRQTPKHHLPNYIQGSSPYVNVLHKNLLDHNNYNLRQNNAQTLYNTPQNVSLMHNSTLSQNMFDNIINWTATNNSGTYSPFGNTETFKPSLFDFRNSNEENFIGHQEGANCHRSTPENDNKFSFNRDAKKTRPLAEVKPMRPSYSDVLTKPVPSTTAKPFKAELKDMKVKKDARKNAKTDKIPKPILINRNSNNDMKEVLDKSLPSKNERKSSKTNQLNRKWASLDNLSQPYIKAEESRKTKKQTEAENVNSKQVKTPKSKFIRNLNNLTDELPDITNMKTEPIPISKNVSKKAKIAAKQKSNENNGNDKKRNQRNKKKESQCLTVSIMKQRIEIYIKKWWEVITGFILWLLTLVSDVCSLSVHLGKELGVSLWHQMVASWHSFTATTEVILKRWRFSAWIWEQIEKIFRFTTSKNKKDDENNFLNNGLETNINMPTTGDEAMKRLLACKGKDPYSILGVTPKCTDDDIKKYYKRQAVLVHPDKNNQPGAEEAFKILVHAFDMIGTTDRRGAYDRGVAESAFVVHNFSQMTELLKKLQQKMEMNANTIRCSTCTERHKRIKVDRPSYAARNCNMCKIKHSAREGDIWAEAQCFGLLWRYYACMEGTIFDITDWAGCQKDTLKHLKPDSHTVQYRIALGKQNHQSSNRRNSATPKQDNPNFENLLNSLYGQNDNGSLRKRGKKKNK